MAEDTTRVSMLWPAELKERVRKEVSGRGMTAFVIEAVEAKLGTHDAHKADSRELNEVKFLVQRLADYVALGGDYEDRASALREIDLPEWVETTGWPEYLAAAINPEAPEEPVIPQTSGAEEIPDAAASSVESVPSSAPELADEGPAIGDPGTVRKKPPRRSTGDLLARVRKKALEKGVDLSGVDLKPAASLEDSEEPEPELEPEPEPEPRVEPEPAPKLEVVQPVQAPAPAASDVCPDCGSLLVVGECWECM